MVIMYGIPNCDTIKKAKSWLEDNGIEYEFHNYKKQGVNPIQLRAWIDEFGWNKIINQRSATWRQLPEETREAMDEMLAIAVAEDNPSIIKRPILESSKGRIIGFTPESYQQHFTV